MESIALNKNKLKKCSLGISGVATAYFSIVILSESAA
jgi:hypothetical protein